MSKQGSGTKQYKDNFLRGVKKAQADQATKDELKKEQTIKSKQINTKKEREAVKHNINF